MTAGLAKPLPHLPQVRNSGSASASSTGGDSLSQYRCARSASESQLLDVGHGPIPFFQGDKRPKLARIQTLLTRAIRGYKHGRAAFRRRAVRTSRSQRAISMERSMTRDSNGNAWPTACHLGARFPSPTGSPVPCVNSSSLNGVRGSCTMRRLQSHRQIHRRPPDGRWHGWARVGSAVPRSAGSTVPTFGVGRMSKELVQ